MAQQLQDHRTPANARYFEWLDRVAPHLAEIQTRVPAAQAADNLSVSNAITSLRSISDADWPEIVAATSVLTRLMLGSPAFAAERDDTRDQTLHAVELLARKSGQSEREVATTLLGLMRGAESSPESGDVDARTVANYWLRGAGRGELRRALGLGRRPIARLAPPPAARRAARLSQRDRPLDRGAGRLDAGAAQPGLRAGTCDAVARRAGGAADDLPGIGGGGRDRQPPDQRIDPTGAPAAPRPRRRHPGRAPDDGRDPGDADLARERPRARPRPRAALPRQPRAPRAVRARHRLARQRRQDRRRRRRLARRRGRRGRAPQCALPGTGRRAGALHRPASRAAPVADRGALDRLGAKARQARAADRLARRGRREPVLRSRPHLDRRRRNALRRHARQRHAPAAGAPARARRRRRASAQPAAAFGRRQARRARLRRSCSRTSRRRCPSPTRSRSTTGCSPASRESTPTARRARRSTRTSSAKARSPARACFTCRRCTPCSAAGCPRTASSATTCSKARWRAAPRSPTSR